MLLDTSESMRYQSDDAPLSKLEYAQCVAAALAYLVLQQQDSVGLVTFDNEIRALVRASSNPSHLKQLLHVMEQTVAAAQDRAPGRSFTTWPSGSRSAGIVVDPERPVRRRGLDDGRAEALSPPPARGDRVPRARSGRARFSLSTNDAVSRLEQLPDVLTDPRALRRRIWTSSASSCSGAQGLPGAERIDYVQLRTDQSLEVALSSYLASRMNRMK